MTVVTGKNLLTPELEQLWRGRLSDLQKEHPDRKMAGLFRGWMPAGFEKCPIRILYVGKATSGSFHEEDVERWAFNGRYHFWSFAREIVSAINGNEDMSCMAWSNISKVAYEQIEAEPGLIRDFENKAVRTLQHEIAVLKPHVVVFVTHHFSNTVVQQVAQIDGAAAEDGSPVWVESQWNRSENEGLSKHVDDVWWKATNEYAVVWMQHPQGAKNEKRAFAAQTIARLARSQAMQ